MNRYIAISVVVLVGVAAVASAQSTTTKPLADIARDEEARRKSVRKPAKVYTNASLKGDASANAASAPAPGTSPGQAATAPSTPESPPAAAPEPAPGEAKDQTYWAGRIKAARGALERAQLFADSLQSRINALQTDFVNRDDPAQKAKIQGDRNAALAELERVKKEIDEHRKGIAAIEDEARRAGVPSGWLRPGA